MSSTEEINKNYAALQAYSEQLIRSCLLDDDSTDAKLVRMLLEGTPSTYLGSAMSSLIGRVAKSLPEPVDSNKEVEIYKAQMREIATRAVLTKFFNTRHYST